MPLIKVKNQYYIDRNDLITWIEQKEEYEQKIALLYILLYITIGIIIIVLLLLF